MDLENLDLEAVDKEMETDKANVARDAAPKGDADEGTSDG